MSEIFNNGPVVASFYCPIVFSFYSSGIFVPKNIELKT
jgi:hypothetical protein